MTFARANDDATRAMFRVLPDENMDLAMKIGTFRAAADYMLRRNGSVDSLIGGYRMYDEICEAIKSDSSIREMFRGVLTPLCYSDPALKTVTMDIGYYLALSDFYICKESR